MTGIGVQKREMEWGPWKCGEFNKAMEQMTSLDGTWAFGPGYRTQDRVGVKHKGGQL